MTRLVRVGDVLELRRRPVDIDPLAEYESIGVRSFGKGIFHYEPMRGTQLSKLRFFEVHPGELVVSNIKAWEGAMAVSSEIDRGCIASNRFLTYVSPDDQVDLRYVCYFLLSEKGLSLIQRASPGSADRNRTLAIDRFENLEIPLPDLHEQRRVVARLDATFERASAASSLLAEAGRLSAGIPIACAHRLTIGPDERSGWEHIELRQVLTPASDSVAVETTGSYPNVGVLSFGRGLFEKPPIDGSATSATRLFRIGGGQFIYSRLFAFEGAYARVDERFDGYYVSNEFPAFDVDSERLDVDFLAAYFRAPTVWQDLAGSSKGLGLRRQRVQPEAMLSHHLWLPPIEEQRRVGRLAALTASTDRLRADSQRRLTALRESILNHAFAGSL